MRNTLLIICIIILGSETTKSQEITKQEKGYFNITEFGYLTGNNIIKPVGSSGENHFKFISYALSLRNINGWFLTNKISIGIGVGLDGYTAKNNYYNYDNTFLIFADARYYFKNTKNTFFAYGDLGSSIAIDDNIERGPMFNFGIGYKFKVTKHAALNASFGYNEQHINIDEHIIGGINIMTNRYSSLAFRIGLFL